jgi:hypothetical protein
MYLLKTLVFFLDSREGPKLTSIFKVGWQEADRVREGRHASSRQTGLREGRQAERRHKVTVRRQADRRHKGRQNEDTGWWEADGI